MITIMMAMNPISFRKIFVDVWYVSFGTLVIGLQLEESNERRSAANSQINMEMSLAKPLQDLLHVKRWDHDWFGWNVFF